MGKKICFVGLSNIQAVPYLYKYVKLLKCEYDIIYWDRKGIDEDCGAVNHYPMKYVIKANATQIDKAIGYLKFKKYAQRILKKENYDGVILLSGNIAVLLRKILKKKYNNRYIVDIRDYYKESNKWYFNAEKDVLDNSAMAVISSKAFKTFLPEHEYHVVHNSQNITREQIEKFRNRSKKIDEQIVISCIGGIRFFEQFKKVLLYFANDNRFLIRFIGYGANVLRDFCEENSIYNVYLHDRFPPEKTLNFYYDTDIIMNLYGNNTPLLDYALSNKLYYAAQLGIPILVCQNTFMEEVAVSNGFGFTFDLEDETMKDTLYKYYNTMNWNEFYKKCDEFMIEVENDELQFREGVNKFREDLIL